MDHSSDLALIHAGECSVGMESYQDCLREVNGAVQQSLYCKEGKRTGTGTRAVVVLEALCCLCSSTAGKRSAAGSFWEPLLLLGAAGSRGL